MFDLNTTDLPIEKIKKCIGDPEADVENEVLKIEQTAQVNIKYLLPCLLKIHKFSNCHIQIRAISITI
jgi:hypothetical protein